MTLGQQMKLIFLILRMINNQDCSFQYLKTENLVFFFMLFDEDFLEFIVRETNNYAESEFLRVGAAERFLVYLNGNLRTAMKL